jgi:hypothetical protein
MSEADVITAIADLGQMLRAEIQTMGRELLADTRKEVKEVADTIASFRLMMEEEFASIRRDNASFRVLMERVGTRRDAR